MMRKIRFNPKFLDGATKAQKEIVAGVATCDVKWGAWGISPRTCDQPIAWLRQDGRRRWIISAFCEVHGSLLKESSEREGFWESFARVEDVVPMNSPFALAVVGGEIR